MMKKSKTKATKSPQQPTRSRTGKGRNKGNTADAKPRRDWQTPFLAQLKISPNVMIACACAAIGRKAAYEARKSVDYDGKVKTGQELADALAFAEKWDDAVATSVGALEESARIRAQEGYARKKFNRQGDPIIDPVTHEQYVEYEYSDTLTMFLLKAHKPDMYGDRARNENFNLNLADMNERQLELIGQGAGLQTVLAAASPSPAGTETPSTSGD